MPRYTAKCHVEQTTNGDTCRQFIEAMEQLGFPGVIVMSCPTYYYGKPYRQFKFQHPNANLAAIMGDRDFLPVFDVKRLWDEDDTDRSYYP